MTASESMKQHLQLAFASGTGGSFLRSIHRRKAVLIPWYCTPLAKKNMQKDTVPELIGTLKFVVLHCN